MRDSSKEDDDEDETEGIDVREGNVTFDQVRALTFLDLDESLGADGVYLCNDCPWFFVLFAVSSLGYSALFFGDFRRPSLAIFLWHAFVMFSPFLIRGFCCPWLVMTTCVPR